MRLGIFEWEIPSGVLRIDSAIRQIHGLSDERSEFQLAEFAALTLHPEDRLQATQVSRGLRRHVEPRQLEHRIIRVDTGEVRWVRVSIPESSDCDDTGQPLRVVGVVQDITAEVAARTRLSRGASDVAAMINNVKGLIWSVDADYRLLAQNRQFSDAIAAGGVPRLMLGDSVLAPYPPEIQNVWRGFYDRALAGERFNHVLDDGTTAMDLSFSPLSGVAGEVAGVACYGVDRTATIRAEQQARDARTEAEKANRAKTDFLANVSHEMRTPMNGVLGMLALLLASDLTPEDRAYAEVAHNSAEALVHLIDDLLDLSKVEAGRLDLRAVAFDVRAAMAAVVGLFDVKAAAKSLAFTTHIAADVPALFKTDPGRLRQVLTNLLSNAIKFTDRGAVTLSLSALRSHVGDGGAALRFSVTDTGIGIPQEDQERIFEAFEQLDIESHRRFSGTGLGLAISTRLVQLMGGSIGVESAVGEGSTFWCDLPVVDLQGETPRVNPHAIDWRSGHGVPIAVRQRARLLLVEDNAVNRNVALSILGKLGYSAQVAESADVAMEALRAAEFDVVFMDLQMPGRSGLECTREIRDPRSGTRDPRVPIVAVTANVMSGVREACLAAGMDDFLPKPIRPEALAELLEHYLTDHESPQPARVPSHAFDGPSPEVAASSKVLALQPILDVNQLMDRFMGDRTLASDILGDFMVAAAEMAAEIDAAIAAEDVDRASRFAHQLKGAAMNINAERLKVYAHKLEVAATGGALGRLVGVVDAVAEALRLIQDSARAAGLQ